MKLFLVMVSIAMYTYARVDSHAPISVMGDHIHKKGDKMVSFRHMVMNMSDIYHGRSKVSEDDYFNDTDYMMAPKDMVMKMNMFGFMYGISDKLTAMIMLNQIEESMTMVRKMGRTETSVSRGRLADSSLGILYGLQNDDRKSFILKFSVLLPTGHHDLKRNGNLMGYPMQTGSGEIAYKYGANYTTFFNNSSLGVDFNYFHFETENDEDYKPGNKSELKTWFAYQLDDSLSVSLLYAFNALDPYRGKSTGAMSSCKDIDAQHGTREFIQIGANKIINSGFFKNHRFAFEYGKPVNRNFKGYLLDITETYTLGWQLAF